MENPSSSARTNAMGLGKKIAIVVAVAVGAGAAGGFLNAMLGLSPVIMWAVLAPTIALGIRSLFGGRGAALDEERTGPKSVLLEAEIRGRRLVQVFLPLAGTMLAVAGVAAWVSEAVRADGGNGVWAGPVALVGAVLVLVSMFYSISWEVSYKGHQIRFQNHPCFAERLFIDGTLVDRGGVGLHMTLRGTIAAGRGAGDLITVRSRAGLLAFSCRIVAESSATPVS